MHQQVAKWNHTYDIKVGDHHFVGTSARSVAFEKRKISIKDQNQEDLVTITESRCSTSFLENIPILNWFITIPFSLEIKGRPCGKIEVSSGMIQGKFNAVINNDRYSCYQHTAGKKGELYSIFKDNDQIGMVRKNKKMEWNAHSYEAEFDDDSELIINTIFLVFIDVLWNTTNVTSNDTVYQTTYEVSYGLDMKFGKKPNFDWKPKRNDN